MLFSKDINKAYYNDLNYEKVDHLLVKILWWHFAFIFFGALLIYYSRISDFFPSPFSWENLTFFEVAGSIIVALLASLLPTVLRGRLDNHYHYRLMMLVSYMLYSFLLVLVSGGAIEMHFYLFGIWALLTLYYDYRIIWIGFALMLLHHLILNFTVPAWLYLYGRNDFALVAYMLMGLPAAYFTARIADNGRRAVENISKANTFIQTKINK